MADVSPLSSADIEVARVRARRRLVGMVVLMGVGVVALPWLFETQPRPMSPDVQVVSAALPRGNGTVPPPRTAPSTIASVTVPVPEAPAESAADEVDEAPAVSKPAAARPSAPAAPASKPAPVRAQASQAVAAKPAPAAAKEPARKEATKPAVAAADNVAVKEKEAARAKSLLEDKPPATKPATAAPDAKTAAKPASDPAGTRYVVQIGAFSDVPTAREVRLKAERAGVKTYTQEVTVNGGKKIRVRVGPYASKAEADKAVDTLRKAGMTSALLTL